MSLMTAHRILIGTAVAFFVFYAAWEFGGVRSGGGAGSMARGALALLGALALAIYFLTLVRGRDPSGRGGEGGHP